MDAFTGRYERLVEALPRREVRPVLPVLPSGGGRVSAWEEGLFFTIVFCVSRRGPLERTTFAACGTVLYTTER